jgi:formylglycine-generating enzyme required for sulfatase activity
MMHYAKKVLLLSFLVVGGLFGEEKREKATMLFLAHLDGLVAKNIITTEGLEHLCQQEELSNPITQEKVHTSHAAFIYHTQLEHAITQARRKKLLDLEEIKRWAYAKREELENAKRTRDGVHKTTKELYTPFSFVALPPGTYTSTFDGKAFTIPAGLEFQETPVTQYQWASFMGSNPAEFARDITIQKIVLHGKPIEMQANHPVTSISVEDIQTFLHKLNEHDDRYTYDLPSLHIFDAALQASLGKQWVDRVKTEEMQQQTHAAGTGWYIEIHQRRIWNILGNVWQFISDPLSSNQDILFLGLLMLPIYVL